MAIADEVGRVRRLSDDELLAGLHGAAGSTRRWTALVLAHLGEVEERRLQLLAGYGSMFDYCTMRLGMSEDEAYRRIEVARLARRFPILFERLADGSLSLSVAALLKARLTEANHVALIGDVSGKTVARAREVLAGGFPQPDVPASIRKLPERRTRTPAAAEHALDPVGCECRPSGAIGTACEVECRARARAGNGRGRVERRGYSAGPSGCAAS